MKKHTPQSTVDKLKSFQKICDSKCSELFRILDKSLTPTILLIAISDKTLKGEPECFIEPHTTIKGVTKKDVLTHSNEIIASGKKGPSANNSKEITDLNSIPDQVFKRAIIYRLSTEFPRENYYTHCSKRIRVENYHICIVVKFSFEQLDSIAIERPEGVDRPESSLNLIYSITEKLLSKIEANISGFNTDAIGNLDESSLLIEAGIDLIESIVRYFNPEMPVRSQGEVKASNLFDVLNKLSLMPYEGKDGLGRFLIAGQNNIIPVIQLNKPITLLEIRELRKLRKLLETSGVSYSLFSDGITIGGICETDKSLKKPDELSFEVIFMSHYKWELRSRERIIMSVDYGRPIIHENRISKNSLDKVIKSVFGNSLQENEDKLWELIYQATEQRHGTMIVISGIAEKEALRLIGTSLNSKSFSLTKDLVLPLSAVDGAIFLDTKLQCHAFGVILDGMASETADAARGARYNSALRYYEYMKREKAKTVVVIISEDGMINLLPDPAGLERKIDAKPSLTKFTKSKNSN